MAEREPYVYVGTGQKGVGKTYRTLEEAKIYILDDRKNGRKGRPVLIFDTNNEFPEIPSIHFDITLEKPESRANPKRKVKDVDRIAHNVCVWSQKVYEGKLKASIKRIVPFKKNGEEMTPSEKSATAGILLKKFRNGMLWLEDMNNYVLGAKSQEVIGAITTNRHRSQDIIVHFQSLSALDPRFIQNINIIRMHCQVDGLNRIKNKVPNLELWEIAKCHVEHQYHKKNNPRCFVYIHNQINMLSHISEADFRNACEIYLTTNRAGLSTLKQLEKNPSPIDGNKKTKSSKGSPRDKAISRFVSDRMYYIKNQ
jgi:hypothetical protein